MHIGGVEINWLGHAGFKIKNSKIIYIDPYQIKGDCEKADLVLITHSHYDHCSIEDIRKVVHEGTTVVMPADCQSKITKLQIPVKMIVVEPGQELEIVSMRVDIFPSYNVDKSFHVFDEGWVGYLIKMNDVLIYHAGDTDLISEMQKLTGYKQADKKFVALLPVGGRFTMSAEEAADAAKLIKPDVAIPMHYGSVVGDEKDAEEFKELCEEYGIEGKILEKE